MLDAGLAAELAEALGAARRDDLVRLAEAALALAGGPLFEGYRASG